jgi:putative ATP-dependent endonuclease of OLD family
MWKVGTGLTVLVGENDSGKTAIVDAIRLTLGSRGEDLRVAVDDFHLPKAAARTSSLLIRCSFEDLSAEEEISFWEWCTLAEDGGVSLHAVLRATLTDKGTAKRTYTEFRSGLQGDGPAIQGALREYLRVTYLRPLRNAEGELSAGRRSRLSQILSAIPEMLAEKESDFSSEKTEEPTTLAGIVAKADHQIHGNETVKGVEKRINQDYLADLSVGLEQLTVSLGIGTKLTLVQVLERLDLTLKSPGEYQEPLRRGLGLNSVLFMAAELLLLQSQSDQLPVLLIEEPEAHLHPQLQARFMQIMSERAADSTNPIQVILTTHSPQLASQARLEDMTLMACGMPYPLANGQTHLEASDYDFLRRFLDATKANLFFAKGVLIVEGDSENLLLPAIAEVLGRSFSKHGVSIVNVGHVGLFRYSRILRRKNGILPIPVACLADLDIPPDSAKDLISKQKTASEYTAEEVETKRAGRRAHDGENVQTFVSTQWTFEHDLALAGLADELWIAVKLIDSSEADFEKIRAEAIAEIASWGALSADQKAVKIYRNILEERISKPMVSQQLARLLRSLPGGAEDLKTRLPGYLIEAIKHVTPGADSRKPMAPFEQTS